MNRRSWCRACLGGIVLSVVPRPRDSRAGEKVFDEAYPRKQAPAFAIPPLEGQRYTDSVPDTVDLAEMAGLSINGMLGPNDPEDGYELYFVVDWFHNPPLMYHEFSSICQSKFLGPLTLNRIASGNGRDIALDRRLIELYLRGIGPEGLYHSPVRGRPWHLHTWDLTTNWGKGKRLSVEEAWKINRSEPPFGNGGINPRLVEGMLVHYLRDHDPMWTQSVQRMIEASAASFVDKGDWGYFGSPDKVPTGFEAANGWNAQALAQAYKVTGDQQAGELAGKYSIYLRDHVDYFEPDGSFRGDQKFFGPERARHGGHFHNHTNCLLGMLEYTNAAGDKPMAEFVRRSYEWARSPAAYSSATIGFFPEFVAPGYPNSEGCPVADMTALAVKLSVAGVGDYWDDVDRWTRNYFSEIQLSAAFADRLEKFSHSQAGGPIPYNATGERVTERNIGAFAGWPSPNDWVHHIGIQHCCTGNGCRAIYYVWENILAYRDQRLRVNLLLNRASPWADVYSSIPYEGRVELRIKQPVEEVAARMPEWIDRPGPEVLCRRNEIHQPVKWDGRYVLLGAAKPGDRLVITFPMPIRTISESIGGADFKMTIKGNTVVSVDPPGPHCSLFRRERFESQTAPWHKVERFVSNEHIDW